MVWSIVPLSQETREYIPTRDAAFHLRRATATLLSWSHGSRNGPVAHIRVGNRLMWSVADIRRAVAQWEAAQ